ncbi:ATP-dependent zinc protease family protein [Marinagarivorans algicola]|uniref:ATP-dependent zinc protease family protein n=1 Tax=Marinagarivorans algicola TaxID=1513270 RepID=UPI0006B50C8C|nr:ATP-dependent zinc protease [Marinagarivorans algicola]
MTKTHSKGATPAAPEPKMIIGSLETCNLPELGINNLEIRVDTGAQTSSLHVDNITRLKQNGKPFVQFDIHPDIYNIDELVTCCTPICDIRRIKSSNGESQERYVIKTLLELGEQSWPIEITLTDRSDMSYLMLFGREGMSHKVLVDPSQTFMLSS